MSKEKLIPVLRFPEFKYEGAWEKIELNEFCLNISSGKNAMSDNGEFPLYGSTGIIGRTDSYSFDGNYILVARVGANAGFLNRASGKFGVTDNTLVLDLKKVASIDFIHYSLDNIGIKKLVFGSGQPLITGGQLKSLQIFKPHSLHAEKEQQKIASCLSSLDAVIAANNQKLDLLKNHKKGLMQNLFPQEGEKVPKYRFKEFEKDGEWEEKIFDDILDITRLAGYEYSEYWKEDEKKEIIALRGYNIGKGTLLLHNLGYISNELSLQLDRSKLYKGDIVYPCVGTIGNAVVIEENNRFHIQQNIAKLTPKKDVSPYFISQFLMSHLGLREVNKFNASSSQPNVLVGSLRNFKICVPKFGEQQKIASSLSALDSHIAAQNEKIEQLKLHKKGLMQGLFPKIVE